MHAIERFGLISLLLLTGSVTAFALWEPAPDPAAERLARADQAARKAESKPVPEPAARNERATPDPDSSRKPRAKAPAGPTEPTATQPSPTEHVVSNPTTSRWVERHVEPEGPAGVSGSERSVFHGTGEAPAGLTPEDPEATRRRRGVRDPEAELAARKEREQLDAAARDEFEPGLTAKPDPPRGTSQTPARRAGASGTRTYVVAKGDVLGTIAQKQLGSVRHQSAILAANPGLDANKIFVGQEIQLPLDVPAAASETPGKAPAPEPEKVATASKPERAPTSTGSTHVVAEGESLWNIARERLGDPKRWQEIAKLNPKVDANSLEPGQVLDLPSGTGAIAAVEQRSVAQPRVSKVR